MNPTECHHLIQQLLDGEISADDFARLDGELRQNPEARTAYQMFAAIHCRLERKGEVDAAIRSVPVVPIDRVIALQRRQFVRTSLLSAAAVITLAALVLWQTMAPEKSAALAILNSTPGSSFNISHAEEGTATTKSTLSAGSTIRLDHGAVELSLPHDVRAILEAPATLTLIDDRTVDLSRGRGYFEVRSAEGHGFTVITASQRIVDLGTAFGVDLPIGTDRTELHVFEGSVRIEGLDGEETGEVIRAPMAVSILGTRDPRQLEGSNDSFLRSLPDRVESAFIEDFESGLLAGKDYAVSMDPTVIRDLAGNRFTGISENEPWRFSTSRELRIRNAGFEVAKVDNGAAVPHWREVTGAPLGFNTHIQKPKPTEGALQLAVSSDRILVQNLGVPIRAGTTYTFTLDIGSEPIIPGQAIVRLFGSDDGFKVPLAEIVVDPPHGQWLRTRTLSFVASADDATGQTLGIALSAKDGRVTYDDLRIFETRAAEHAEPPAIPSLEIGANGQPDTRPPLVSSRYPAADAPNAELDDIPILVFDEPVRFGTGRIVVRNLTDNTESELVVGSNRTSLSDRVLSFLPPLGLADGAKQFGGIPGWACSGPVSRFNPIGDGNRYRHPDLADDSKARGTLDSMIGPTLATLGNAGQPGTMRRQLGKAQEGRIYTVSVGIGCRTKDAADSAPFAGYRIRLLRDSTVLAEISGKKPPGRPNSVTPVGFSWESAPNTGQAGSDAPLVLEISTLAPVGGHTGDLDIDHVKVTSLGGIGG